MNTLNTNRMLFTPLISIKPFSIYRHKHIVSHNVVPFHIFYSLLHIIKTVEANLTKITKNLNTINTNRKLFTPLKSSNLFSIYRYKHIVSDNVVPSHYFYSLLHNSKTVKTSSTKVTQNLNTINTNRMLFTQLKSLKPFSIFAYKHIVSLNVAPFQVVYRLHHNSKTVTLISITIATTINTIHTNRMLFTPLKSVKPFSIYRHKHIVFHQV